GVETSSTPSRSWRAAAKSVGSVPDGTTTWRYRASRCSSSDRLCGSASARDGAIGAILVPDGSRPRRLTDWPASETRARRRRSNRQPCFNRTSRCGDTPSERSVDSFSNGCMVILPRLPLPRLRAESVLNLGQGNGQVRQRADGLGERGPRGIVRLRGARRLQDIANLRRGQRPADAELREPLQA